jgi:hypothetical protein
MGNKREICFAQFGTLPSIQGHSTHLYYTNIIVGLSMFEKAHG